MRLPRPLCAVLAALLPLCASAKTLTVGVLDVQPTGASSEVAVAATGLVAHEVERLGMFRVVTSSLIRDLLALERQKQLMGCSSESCLTEIGAALGMDLLVTGKVTRVKGSSQNVVALELSLADVAKTRQAGSEVEAAESEAALVSRIPSMVTRLFSKVLGQHSGQLLLVSTESGATVKLNNRAVGTTPLVDPLTVPGGVQRLLVEKEGFVSLERELRITPGGLTQESVALVPSPDFVRAYEATHGRIRIAAWSSTALAIVGVAASSVLLVRASGAYGNTATSGTFLFHRARLLAGVEVEGAVDHRAEALRLKGEVDSLQTFGLGAAGLAAASGIAAGVLWLIGDDPNRYQHFRRTAPGGAKVSAWVAPESAGAAVSLEF